MADVLWAWPPQLHDVPGPPARFGSGMRRMQQEQNPAHKGPGGYLDTLGALPRVLLRYYVMTAAPLPLAFQGALVNQPGEQPQRLGPIQ